MWIEVGKYKSKLLDCLQLLCYFSITFQMNSILQVCFMLVVVLSLKLVSAYDTTSQEMKESFLCSKLSTSQSLNFQSVSNTLDSLIVIESNKLYSIPHKNIGSSHIRMFHAQNGTSINGVEWNEVKWLRLNMNNSKTNTNELLWLNIVSSTPKRSYFQYIFHGKKSERKMNETSRLVVVTFTNTSLSHRIVCSEQVIDQCFIFKFDKSPESRIVIEQISNQSLEGMIFAAFVNQGLRCSRLQWNCSSL